MLFCPNVEKKGRMRVIPLWLLVCLSVAEGQTLANWSANYPPCNRHAELLKQSHMNLGVRVATTNAFLAEQFGRAMDSWAKILDLDWHEDDTESCSIQLVDGASELFLPASTVARSHLPGRLGFQGWVAFNPAHTLTGTELYRISLHEIGHMLGLQHSSNASSVMYFLDLDGLELLDPADLASLAEHHKLRIAALDKPVAMGAGPAPEASRK
jgi:hypothetical protein